MSFVNVKTLSREIIFVRDKKVGNYKLLKLEKILKMTKGGKMKKGSSTLNMNVGNTGSNNRGWIAIVFVWSN